MIRKLVLCILMAFSLAFPAKAQNGELLWQDSFDTFEKSHWTMEEGFLRNNEPQWYTPRGVSVSDGCLVLRLQKWEDGSYTSGSVHTSGKLEIGPNTRLDVRARLEGDYGVWPAIWLHASRFTQEYPLEVWPAGGEIDLMEVYEDTVDGFSSTLHFRGADGEHTSVTNQVSNVDLRQWHTYTLAWERTLLSFYLDGTCYWRVDTGQWDALDMNPFSHDSNGLALHLNLAMLPGEDPGNAAFVVDEVRVIAIGPVHPCQWVRFREREVSVPLYGMIGCTVDLDPEAQDRTVLWQVDSDVLEPVQESTVKGYYYAARRGEATVTVTTPSGCVDTCRVIVY